MPPLWPGEGIVQVDGDNRVASRHSFADCRRETGEEESRRRVLREDLGSKPFDTRIARSGHQGSHEFARHTVVLPFVGHQDRDLSGGGIGLVSGVARHTGDATVIDCDHCLVSPWARLNPGGSRRTRLKSHTTAGHDKPAPRSKARPGGRQTVREPEHVLDVPPKLAARVRLLDTGQINKTTTMTPARSRSPRCAPGTCPSWSPRTRPW